MVQLLRSSSKFKFVGRQYWRVNHAVANKHCSRLLIRKLDTDDQANRRKKIRADILQIRLWKSPETIYFFPTAETTRRMPKNLRFKDSFPNGLSSFGLVGCVKRAGFTMLIGCFAELLQHAGSSREANRLNNTPRAASGVFRGLCLINAL
jgi:hypothetical protein